MKIEIDARGLNCPMPVINTEGLVITTVDNEIAKENILKLAISLNCEAKVIKEEKDLISIEIKKGENVIIDKNENIALDDKCIFISSDKMGEDNYELGKLLIKGFVYTLTECKPYPKQIILVNGGVKLSSENEDTIENLKVLEESGVEILSCGTCLDYYGLKEKLKVGTVTNMYTIVELMKNSSQTISI
ncbi:MAG: sulfurtransferase-like selenium metabolism protein YedF [Peptostreptococcaceae bacterium]